MKLRGILFALLPLLGALASAQYQIFAAETQPFNLGSNTSQYGGLRAYTISAGGTATLTSSLPNTSLNDPLGVVQVGSDVFVSNRVGNTTGQGIVQRFTWNGTSLTGGATIATAASPFSQGFHGFNFAPNGDLFVTTVSNGTRRYRDSGSGYVEIGGSSAAQTRDAWITPDGSTLIETGVGFVRSTPILANSLGSSTQIGAGNLHQMSFRNGNLYVTEFATGAVQRITFNSSNIPTSITTVVNQANALGLTFSPDGNEMFVGLHTSGGINRYLWNGSSWVANGNIATGTSMGYLGAVPEPFTLGILSLGALALRRRRAKKS